MKFPAKAYHLRILQVAATIIVLISSVLWVWNKSSLQETVLLSRTGKMKAFYLPDSSHVTLTGDSRLTYDSQFERRIENFPYEERHFPCKQDSSKPFIVETSLIQVEVLGTSFHDCRKTSS